MSGCTAPRWRLGLVDGEYVIWAGPDGAPRRIATCGVGDARLIIAAVNAALDAATVCEWGDCDCPTAPWQGPRPSCLSAKGLGQGSKGSGADHSTGAHRWRNVRPNPA